VLRLGDRDTFALVYRPNDWAVRVRGYGLSVKSLRGHRPLFSEREGFVRCHHGLGLAVMVLNPRR
jgi:hypothetical protein